MNPFNTKSILTECQIWFLICQRSVLLAIFFQCFVQIQQTHVNLDLEYCIHLQTKRTHTHPPLLRHLQLSSLCKKILNSLIMQHRKGSIWWDSSYFANAATTTTTPPPPKKITAPNKRSMGRNAQLLVRWPQGTCKQNS